MKIVRKVEKVVVEEETLCANDCSVWHAVCTAKGSLLALHYSQDVAYHSAKYYEDRYGTPCIVEKVYPTQITL